MKTENVQRIIIVVLLIVVGVLVYGQVSTSAIAQVEAGEGDPYQIREIKLGYMDQDQHYERTVVLLFKPQTGETWAYWFNTVSDQRWVPVSRTQ